MVNKPWRRKARKVSSPKAFSPREPARINPLIYIDLGSKADGVLSQYRILREDVLVKTPEHMSDDEVGSSVLLHTGIHALTIRKKGSDSCMRRNYCVEVT